MPNQKPMKSTKKPAASSRKTLIQVLVAVLCLAGAAVAYIRLSPQGPGPVVTPDAPVAETAPPPPNPNASLKPQTQMSEAETTEFMTQRRGTVAPTGRQ